VTLCDTNVIIETLKGDEKTIKIIEGIGLENMDLLPFLSLWILCCLSFFRSNKEIGILINFAPSGVQAKYKYRKFRQD